MSDALDPIAIATIRDGQKVRIDADEALRGAIAKRLRLLSVERFEAEAVLGQDGGAVSADGRVKAAVTQACTATGDPVEETIDEPFTLLFAAQPDVDEDEEIELAADDLDTIFHDGRTVPLGDAIVDTLALALDPYPRAADADERLRAAGVLREEEAGAFGALAELKKKMEGGD
ncbi:DUF177 domain-containing protein [Sphingomicrobium sp. XHP0239]|uniref:YceD family protein n=1 Tax=Sphingomicrobium maritimum TaxID=3133972 RepID=UPI0031CCB6EE